MDDVFVRKMWENFNNKYLPADTRLSNIKRFTRLIRTYKRLDVVFDITQAVELFREADYDEI